MARALTAEAAEIVGNPLKHSIHERLQAYLLNAATGHDKRLARALTTAAEQLEYLTPAVMAATRGGLYTGAVTHTQRGAILIVLAEGRRCLTSHFKMLDVAKAFDQLVAMAVEADLTDNPGAVTSAMVKRWGERPGEKSTRGSPNEEQISIVLGTLLRQIPTDGLAALARAVEQIRKENFCPALVGLVGPSSSGVKDTLSFVWPLLIPVAEYIEVFTERADAGDSL